jgi:hypothetical protein
MPAKKKRPSPPNPTAGLTGADLEVAKAEREADAIAKANLTRAAQGRPEDYTTGTSALQDAQNIRAQRAEEALSPAERAALHDRLHRGMGANDDLTNAVTEAHDRNSSAPYYSDERGHQLADHLREDADRARSTGAPGDLAALRARDADDAVEQGAKDFDDVIARRARRIRRP